MNINPETPMHEITCAGITLSAPAPYAEGHTLTPNEAAVLNQTLAENLRNNFASKVKAAQKAAIEAETEVDVGALVTEFGDYVASYEFGVRRTGGTRAPVDPVEKEALSIAIAKVKAALKAKGLAIKDVPAEQIRELATAAVEKHPQIREQAAKVVAMKAEMAAEALDLDIG